MSKFDLKYLMLHCDMLHYYCYFRQKGQNNYFLEYYLTHREPFKTVADILSGGRGFDPCRGRQHSFVEIDHEIFSTVILSLPLIQEGQLSVSGKRMCTILVNRLED